MATKLNTRATKNGRRVPDGKRMAFACGRLVRGGSDRTPKMVDKKE